MARNLTSTPIVGSARAVDSVWLREARAYPNGVGRDAALPRDRRRALAMLADGRQRGRRRARGEPRARRRHAVPVRLRRRPARDRLGRRGARRTAASGARRRGATARARVRRPVGPRTTMPTFGPHPVTVPGARRRLVHAARAVGDAGRSASSRGRALHYAEDGFPLTRRGAVVLHAQPRSVRPLRTARLRRAYYGDVEPGDWMRQPELGAHDPHARRRRARRVLPRRDRRRDRGAAAGARRVHDRRRPRRARRARGSSRCARRSRTSRSLELPPPTQGVTALEALRIADGFDLGPTAPTASTCSSRR